MNVGIFTTIVVSALAVAVLVVYPLIRLYFAEKEAHTKRVLKQMESSDDGKI